MLIQLTPETLVELSAQLQLGAEMVSRYLLPQGELTEQSLADSLQVRQDIHRVVTE